MMLIVMIASAVAAAQTPAARDIERLCRSEPACVADQRQSLKHFLGMLVVFDGGEADAERCMRAARTNARLIDWTAAEQCLRDWSKGRKSLIPRPPSDGS